MTEQVRDELRFRRSPIWASCWAFASKPWAIACRPPSTPANGSARTPSDSCPVWRPCKSKRRNRGSSPHLLSHVSFSVLMAADEEDTIEILSIAEMPFISVPTRLRGVQLTVITGPLSRWQDAVKLGSESSCARNVRLAFNAVKSIFGDAGLDVWKDCAIRPLADGTFLLEDKR